MDVATLRHVAKLAELSLSPEEEPRLVADLSAIVAHMGELAAVDTEGVEISETAAAKPAMRADEPEDGLSHEDALAAAKRTAHGGFVVPTFVE